jgi:RHS repeat-associated protein
MLDVTRNESYSTSVIVSNKSVPSGATGTAYAAAYSTATNQVSGGLISPTPTYDANGNQLTSTPATLTWNALAQPISVSGTTATYDALGRMVEKGSGGAFTQFVYRPSGAQLAVYSGSLVKGTIPLPGGSTAVYNASGVNFIRHKDWLGSSRLATTWAHAVYSKEAYAPFGETYNEAGTPDRSFTGQDQNVVNGSGGTGVYDFLFRKYDPSAGRWLSPDPYGWNAVDQTAPQSMNRYAYAMNNPLALTDPYGLDDCGADTGTVSVEDCDSNDGYSNEGGSDDAYGGDDGGWVGVGESDDPIPVFVIYGFDCAYENCGLNVVTIVVNQTYCTMNPLSPSCLSPNGPGLTLCTTGNCFPSTGGSGGGGGGTPKQIQCAGQALKKNWAQTGLDSLGLIPGESTIVKAAQIVGAVVSGGIAASKADTKGVGLSGAGFILTVLDAEKVPIGKNLAEAVPVLGIGVSAIAVGNDILGSEAYKACMNGAG